MNKKLTLNVDDSVIQFAYLYSKETNQSISPLFENTSTGYKNTINQLIILLLHWSFGGAFKDLKSPDKQ